MSEYIITTDRLTKQFGQTKVVDSVSLHIKKGAIYGLIGRNGAGKTTIMKMLCGLSQPTDGSFKYEGFNCSQKEVLSRVGALIEEPALYPNLSAKDNLKIKCLAYGIGDRDYIQKKLELVGLGKVGKKKVGKFSLGMKQRLGIAMALIGEPDFLLLDEPINGLDPQGIAEVRDMITRLNKEKNITILISSHILGELAKMATDYAIIEKGKIIEEAASDDLFAKCRDRIVIKSPDVDRIIPVIDAMGVTEYKSIDTNTLEVYEKFDEVSKMNMQISSAGIPIDSIGVVASDLEDYFIKVTGVSGKEGK